MTLVSRTYDTLKELERGNKLVLPRGAELTLKDDTIILAIKETAKKTSQTAQSEE